MHKQTLISLGTKVHFQLLPHREIMLGSAEMRDCDAGWMAQPKLQSHKPHILDPRTMKG